MNIFLILLFVLAGIIILRLIFRRVIDLPDYSGQLLADNSGISALMPESDFWEIIKISRQNSNKNYRTQCSILEDTLKALSEDEIISFNRTFTTLMSKSYSFRLWEAAYALNGGCSDDCFEYFRSWLIGQGRNKFYWTIRYPRVLLLIGVKEMFENYEGLAYCAYNAYQSKSGRELPKTDDIIYEDGGKIFNEGLAFIRYPELALLTW